ncbi:hypothetical protein ABLV87_03495 [Klebsiella sp. JB_Kp018]|nr:hypothetical protein KU664_21040 [Klebsiella variicola]
MLSQIEKERIEQLENELKDQRNQIEMQQILISGLLHNFFRTETSNQSAFFEVLSEELNKLRLGSVKQQEFSHCIQQLVDRYR